MIVQDEQALRKASTKIEPSLGLTLASKLANILDVWPDGIGLAAPQMGIYERVFVFLKEDGGLVFVINPNLLSKQEPFLHKNEGCLSFPGKSVNTIRYRKIVFTDHYRKTPIELTGRDAVVFLHEFEHLNGVLMFDNREPKKYDRCFCGSEKKYKFCCYEKINDKS